ncbi:MAG: nucleoside kinase [Firmicutes bacterium]|nr:nucleoside kinase [[Eubacterium] siraeum]MCM1489086.1 nucleoside kinase [Bacillota bacterium]
MNVLSVKDLNKELNFNTAAAVNTAEDLYHQQLDAAADTVALNAAEKPIVLLSGPSGSAKTTTALRLKKLLEERSLAAHVISMDNYFLPLNGLSPEERSKIDLEAPSRVDLKLLEEHLGRFLDCLPTQIPTFNFADQTRGQGELLCRQEKEIIIIEGIHALNPEVIGSVHSHAVGMYVSVRTRLSLEKQLLHPSKIRLMRRLMRDRLFRGREIEDIVCAFQSVQRGEQLYIMPYKGNASINIDTFMSYEAAAYCNALLPLLEKVSPYFEHYDIVRELIVFLNKITPIQQSAVPEHSIIREFIGGSIFSY